MASSASVTCSHWLERTCRNHHSGLRVSLNTANLLGVKPGHGIGAVSTSLVPQIAAEVVAPARCVVPKAVVRILAAETAAAFFAAPGTTVIGIAAPVYLQRRWPRSDCHHPPLDFAIPAPSLP